MEMNINGKKVSMTSDVKVEFVKPDGPPTNLGEPGLAPLAPAVALFRFNDKRIRSLPYLKGTQS
jgi:isoquinoline 1-oxidoreductase subunit beta